MASVVDGKLARSEAIMQKIEKILRHARHNENAAEAANAAALVQKLMLEYNLSEEEIASYEARPTPSPVMPEEMAYSSKKGRIMWQFSLFCTVAKVNFCKFLSYTGQNRGVLIGETVNRAVAKEVYFYLRDEIERLHRISFAEHRATAYRPMHGRMYYSQFCNGAVDIVANRLNNDFKAAQATNNNISALIVLKDKLVDAKTKELFPRMNIVNTGVKYRSDGYYEGVEAGRSIPLAPGARQLTA